MFFEQALGILPDNIDARVLLAQTLSWMKAYVRAEEEYRRVLDLQEDHFDARFGLAQTLAWQTDYVNALLEFQLLSSRHPENAEVLGGIGETYFWIEDYAQAAEYLERAIAAGPESVDAHLNLADTYYELEDWERAHEQYEIVTNLDPSLDRAAKQETRTRALTSKNEVHLYGFLEQFSQDDRTPHYSMTAQYHRRLTRSIRVIGTLGFVRKRFANKPFDDGFAGTGLTIRLAHHSILSMSVNVAPGAEVIPQIDFISEFSQGGVPGVEFSITHRLMDFDETTVNIVSPGVIYYLPGEATVMLRLYGAFSEGADRTDAVFGRFTYGISSMVSTWIGLVEGNEVIRGLSLENLRNLSSRSYLLHVDYSVRSELTVLFDYQYLIRRGLFTEHVFGLGVRYRW